MIALSLAWAIAIYLALFLGAIAVVWVVYSFDQRRREARLVRRRVRCHICMCEFEDPAATALVRCPVCDSLNERTGVERI